MAQALTAFVIFMIVAGGVMVTLSRRTRTKMKESVATDAVKLDKPRSLSRRQQRIVSTLEPTKNLPSIEQLVAEEALETGVNSIPGGHDLDVSLKLRVYWRDEVVRQGCSDGVLEFRIDDDIDPAQAETEDVRLVCVRNGVDVAKTDSNQFNEATAGDSDTAADESNANSSSADEAD